MKLAVVMYTVVNLHSYPDPQVIAEHPNFAECEIDRAYEEFIADGHGHFICMRSNLVGQMMIEAAESAPIDISPTAEEGELPQ